MTQWPFTVPQCRDWFIVFGRLWREAEAAEEKRKVKGEGEESHQVFTAHCLRVRQTGLQDVARCQHLLTEFIP